MRPEEFSKCTSRTAHRFAPDAILRRPILIVGFIGLLALFHLAVIERAERPGNDSCTYIQLAKNLIRHGRYDFNFVPHTKYPPGFPLLLAGWMMISEGTGYTRLMSLQAILGGFGLVAWFFALRYAFHPGPAACGVILTGVSWPYFFLATRMLLSELPFLFFTGVTFLLFSVLLGAPDRPKPVRLAILAALLFSCAYAVAVRTAGIAAGAALLAWAFSRSVRETGSARAARVAALAAGLLCVAVFAGWMARGRTELALAQKDRAMATYGEEFLLKNAHEPDLGLAKPEDYIERAIGSIPLRAAQMAAVVLPCGWIAPIWYSPMMCILLFSILGVWIQRGDSMKLLFGLYLLFYLGVLWLWPFEEDARFVLPVMPIAIGFFAEGARAAWLGVRRAARMAAGAASGCCLVAVLAAFWHPPAGRQEWLSLGLAGFVGLAAIVVLTSERAAGAIERLHAVLWNGIRPLVTVLAMVLIGLSLSRQVRGATENLHPDPSRYVNEEYRRASMWLLQAPPGNVMAGGCSFVHRYSGRPCFFLRATSDPDRNLASIRRNAGRFLVVVRERKDRPAYFRPSEEERLRGIQRKAPDLLRIVAEERDFLIFETDASVWRKASNYE